MEHIGRQLKRIHNIMDRSFNNALTQYDLTSAQLEMLILLFRNKGEPMCQRDIEHRLQLKNPTVTGTLKRLEAKGMIVRTTMEHDRRFNQITLTDRARELDNVLLSSIRQNDAAMLRGFGEDELMQLSNYLGRLIDNLTEQGG